MSRVGIFIVYWFSCYIAVVNLVALPIPTFNPDKTQSNITHETPSIATINATEATHVEHPLTLTTNSILTSNNSNSTLDPIEEKQTCFSGRCRYPSRCCPGYECSLLQFPPFFSGICIAIATNPPYEVEDSEEDDDEDDDDEEDEEDEVPSGGTDADADNQPHMNSNDSEGNSNNNNNSSSNPEVSGNVQQLSPEEHQELVAIANDTILSLSLDHITQYVNSIRPNNYLIYSSYYNLYGNPASYNIPGYDRYANRKTNHSYYNLPETAK